MHSILRQYTEGAATLWIRRDYAVRAPHYAQAERGHKQNR